MWQAVSRGGCRQQQQQQQPRAATADGGGRRQLPWTATPDLEAAWDPVPAGDSREDAVGGAQDVPVTLRRHPLQLGIHNRNFLPKGQSPLPPRRRRRRSQLDSALHNYTKSEPSQFPQPRRAPAAHAVDGPGPAVVQRRCDHHRVTTDTRGGGQGTGPAAGTEARDAGAQVLVNRTAEALVKAAEEGDENGSDGACRTCDAAPPVPEKEMHTPVQRRPQASSSYGVPRSISGR